MEGFAPSVLWATSFTILGTLLGVASLLIGVWFVPKLVDRFTPHIDEEMEILKGNQAVATYFGLVVGCTIVGISIIIGAAIIAGIHG